MAAQFSASVDRNQVAVGERLSLMLELSGASAKGSPDVSPLNQHFHVTPGGQSTKTTIVNGNFSSSTHWQYMLIPKEEGKITIPELGIQTSDGDAKSESIELSVMAASSLPDTNQEQSISVSAKASKRDPYKNEPITYKVTFVSQKDLANIQLSELKLDDAIIETVKQPAVYDQIFNGVPVKIIEATYRITPLKSGKITIPAIVVQGDIATKDRRNRIGSLLDEESDSLFDRLNAFGFTKLKPFSIASNKITLDVKPPVSRVKPWLPAELIKLSERWNNAQSFQVGEPITRNITIKGAGIAASQLPDLGIQLKDITGFRVYADKPETKNDIQNEKLTSWRKENYTLIPQQAGTFTLPEITISWWNTLSNKLEHAKIEARTLEILPDKQDSQQIVATTKATTSALENEVTTETPLSALPTTKVVRTDSPLLYAIIAGLLIILFVVIFWVIRLQRKITHITNTISTVPVETNHELADTYSEINERTFAAITSATELQHYLQSYGIKYWHVPKNASLETVLTAAKIQNPAIADEADIVLKALQDALYAEKTINIEEIKKTCTIVLASNSKKNNKAGSKSAIEKLSDLNPS